MKALMIFFLIPLFSVSQKGYTPDQHLHYWSGFGIAQGATALGIQLNLRHPEVFGTEMGILAGFLKEGYDHVTKHGGSLRSDSELRLEDHLEDLFMTASGAMASMFVHVIIERPLLRAYSKWYRKKQDYRLGMMPLY